ncbi:MAG: hypothetical protein ACYTGL_24220 [Planctomycetota bacterium]
MPAHHHHSKHHGNDGFNIHGARKGTQLENVRALSNADEGISAHETVEMNVVGAEVAWNGSAGGGFVDVNDSGTHFRGSIVRDNAGAAFYFSGNSHTVTDTSIVSQPKTLLSAAWHGLRAKQVHVAQLKLTLIPGTGTAPQSERHTACPPIPIARGLIGHTSPLCHLSSMRSQVLASRGHGSVLGFDAAVDNAGAISAVLFAAAVQATECR